MWNWIILIVTTLLSYALAPKPPKQKAPTLADFEVPTAEQGRPIPVVFGTNRITGANVVWYGDLDIYTQTQNGVKTRRYYMGLHFALCHGPIDALTKIYGGDKEAWTGSQTANGVITIDAPNLWGGKEKEGGLDGDLDVMLGGAAQTANTYLTTAQGTPQPAYRGVTSLVYNRGLVSANSQYLKPWAFDVRRIHEGWDADTEWYAERAGIGGTGGTDGVLALNEWTNVRIVKDGLDFYLFIDGVLNDSLTLSEEIGGGQLTATSGGGTQLDGSLTIGRYRVQDALYPYSGHIDEFLFFRDVALSTADYTPAVAAIDSGHPNWADLEICLHMDGTDGDTTFTDETGRTWTTISPAEIDSAQSVFGGESGYFHTGGGGARAAIHTPYTSSISFAGTWTIDLRIRPTANVYYHVFNAFHINDFFPGYALINRGDSKLEFYIGNHNYPSGDIHALGRLYQQPTDGAAPFSMNPAHIVYEALTNGSWGMGYPAASVIDDATFRDAADVFYGEGLGLCLQWVQQEPVENFIQVILDHAGAILRQSPTTGLLQLKALRGDYDAASLPVYDEDSIVAVESFDRAGYGELVGEVSVVYRNYLTNQDETVTVQNLATIQSQEGVVSESIQYPGIPTQELAQKIAMRDLKARSHPLARVKLKVNRTAWDLLPGDVFKLSWSKLGLTEVIMRVGGVDYGTLTDGTITVEAVEDVFGMPSSTYAASQDTLWTESSSTPVAATAQTAIELPLWWLRETIGDVEATALAATDGYGYPLGVSTLGTSDGHEVWVSLNSGDYARSAPDADWLDTALLNGAVTRYATTLTIDNSYLSNAEVGDLLQIGTGALAEIVRLTGGNLTTSLTVTRGHLDTTPQEHADNTRIFRMPEPILVDTTVYTDGDSVAYKMLTTTSSGVLTLAGATATTITMDSRATRPIAPGNVKINGEYEATVTHNVAPTISWTHRDRWAHLDTTLQTDTGISTEASVTYSAYVYDDADDSVESSTTGLTGTTWTPTLSGAFTARVEIAAVRAGLESYQRQVRLFEFDSGAGDPYYSSVEVLLHFNGTDGSTTFTDNSSNAWTVTVNGNAQIDTAQSKFGGASGLFDGTGDYIEIADNAALEPGSSDFTYECWIRPANTSAGVRTIVAKRGNNSAFGPFAIRQSGTQVNYAISTSGSSYNVSNTAGTIAANTWYHVALVRSGTTFTLYIDGTAVDSSTVSGSLVNNAGQIVIGADTNGSGYNGWIDEARYTVGLARYTSDFTPPTAAFADS